MEGDDGQNSPRLQGVVQDAVEGEFQLSQLLVDGDPQGLKDACGGVTCPGTGACRGEDALKSVDQILPGFQGMCRAPGDKLSGDAATGVILSILMNNVGQLLLVDFGQPGPRRFSLRTIEP